MMMTKDYEQIYINGTAYYLSRRVTGTMTSEVELPLNKKQVPFHVQQQMRKKKGNKRGFK